MKPPKNRLEKLKTGLNSVKLSDPFYLQDLILLLAWPDGPSISDEVLEGHQSSLLTAQPPSSQRYRARLIGR
jgi:hypothetical protein